MECAIIVLRNFGFYWGNIGLYIMCLMCMSFYFYFYIHCSMLTTKNLGFICQHAVVPVYPFAPLSHPPLLTAILFSISVCLFLFDLFLFTCFLFVFILVTLFLFCSFLHMGEVIQCLSFSIWFIVLSIILLGPSMLQMARPYLLWLNSIPFVCMHIYHMLFIHSCVDGHLDCFHILAIVSKTVMNIGCIYLFKLLFFFSLDEYPEVE